MTYAIRTAFGPVKLAEPGHVAYFMGQRLPRLPDGVFAEVDEQAMEVVIKRPDGQEVSLKVPPFEGDDGLLATQIALVAG